MIVLQSHHYLAKGSPILHNITLGERKIPVQSWRAKLTIEASKHSFSISESMFEPMAIYQAEKGFPARSGASHQT